MVGEPCNHLGMVYTTHLWWFWGWFIIGSTTLQYLWWYTSIQIFDCDMHSHGYIVEMYKHMLYMHTQLVYICQCTYTCTHTVDWLVTDMAMNQYLLIPFLGGWTSIYQLFWCSPGVQGFDTLPYYSDHFIKEDPLWLIEALASRSTATSVSCSTQTEEMKGASGNWWPPWGWRWVVNLACWRS